MSGTSTEKVNGDGQDGDGFYLKTVKTNDGGFRLYSWPFGKDEPQQTESRDTTNLFSKLPIDNESLAASIKTIKIAMADALKTSRSELIDVPTGSTVSSEVFRNGLKAIGQLVWERAVHGYHSGVSNKQNSGDSFTDFYRLLYEAWCDEKPKNLLILGDETDWPWEILCPPVEVIRSLSPPRGAKDPPMLGVICALSRWPQDVRAPQRISIDPGEFMTVASNARQFVGSRVVLPEPTLREIDFLMCKYGDGKELHPLGTTIDFITTLKNQRASVVHVAAHGNAGRDDSDGPQLVLADRPFYLEELDQAPEQKPHPRLVVLNACQMDAVLWQSYDLDSTNDADSRARWATVLIKNWNVGAVIVPRWAVRASVSEQVAKHFYERLERGDTIAEAMRKSRALGLEAGLTNMHPTWFSYAVYAHPETSVPLMVNPDADALLADLHRRRLIEAGIIGEQSGEAL